MTLQIQTNNQWRSFLYGYEVPQKVIEDQFLHLDDDQLCDGFIKYKGYYYHLSDFTNSCIDNWQGQINDSFFSGVLIRIGDDCEHYQVATFYS